MLNDRCTRRTTRHTDQRIRNTGDTQDEECNVLVARMLTEWSEGGWRVCCVGNGGIVEGWGGIVEGWGDRAVVQPGWNASFKECHRQFQTDRKLVHRVRKQMPSVTIAVQTRPVGSNNSGVGITRKEMCNGPGFYQSE